MKIKKITIYVVLFIVALGVIYDFYAIAVGGTEASISHLMKMWGHKYPIVPFAMGVLMGHFYWPIKETKEIAVINEAVKKLDE